MSNKYYNPTEVVAGAGSFAEIGGLAGRFGQRVLVVRSSSAPDPAEFLEAAGLSVMAAPPVRGEPTVDQVEAILAVGREAGVDVVLAVGGGSPIDAGKAAAGLFAHFGAVREYHSGERKVHGGGLPFIAVPTTSGAGAEVTKNAVISDPEHKRKASIRHDSWFPRVALLDPQLTHTVPPQVTAASGSDALCQAIEAYVSVGAGPVTDALALEAIERIGRSLTVAYREPTNHLAREDMHYGALLAGLALASARLGAVHGMAHPLGIRYELRHGVICGLLLPPVMAYNLDYAPAKYENVARLLGADDAQAGVERVRALFQAIDIPLHLRELGVEQEAFPVIAEESMPSGSLKHNPRPLEAEDVVNILEMAW